MGERRLARKVFLAFSWNPNERVLFVRTVKNLVNVFLPLPLMPTETGKTVLRECTKRLLSSLRRSTDYQKPRRSSEKTEDRGGLLSHWIWRKGGSGEGSEEGLFRPPPPPPVSLSPSIANKRRSSKVVSSLFLLLLLRRRRNCTSAFAAPLSVPKGGEERRRFEKEEEDKVDLANNISLPVTNCRINVLRNFIMPRPFFPAS